MQKYYRPNATGKKRNKKKVWELPLDPIEAEALELPDDTFTLQTLQNPEV